MSTIPATVSIMQDLPEATRKQILTFAQELYEKQKSDKPFAPLAKEKVHSDINTSEQQIDAGEGIDARKAVMSLRRKYGFA